MSEFGAFMLGYCSAVLVALLFWWIWDTRRSGR